MTLIPQRRLLVFLLIGTLLVLLVLVHPVFLLVFLGYYAAIIGLVITDASRLPRRPGFAASRVLPEPFSLGEVQAVQVLVAHADAAGLRGEIADHVPPELRPDRRTIAGQFDAQGLLTAEYAVQPPHRGQYRFGPVEWLWRSMTYGRWQPMRG